MNTDIRYIFLDLGGTFRVIDEDPAYLAAARAKIAELCGVETENPTQWFADVIDKRYDQYREWALKYMCEAPEEVLWRRWLAYDCDPERIRKNAAELCYQYRQTKGRRTVVEGGAETVKELCRRGYTMGIISDLVGKREVDEWLDQDGLRPYFQTVQQSSVTYVRKPGPAIYYYAMLDLIVSNPPYLTAQEMSELQPEVAKEPAMALEAGEDGLVFYKAIAEHYQKALRPGGALALEIGWQQREAVTALLEANGWADIACRKDFGGNDRCVTARRPK